MNFACYRGRKTKLKPGLISVSNVASQELPECSPKLWLFLVSAPGDASRLISRIRQSRRGGGAFNSAPAAPFWEAKQEVKQEAVRRGTRARE